MKKIIGILLLGALIVLMVAIPAQSQNYRAWWRHYWGRKTLALGDRGHHDYGGYGRYNGYDHNGGYKETYTYHYGNDNGHSVASIQRLPRGQGFLIVLEDGRVVTVDSSGKIVADNNHGRLWEKTIPWAAILGAVGILAH